MEYTNGTIPTADILFVPVIFNQYDKYYDYVHKYLVKDATKQSDEQDIFLPYLDYTQNNQSSKLVYYVPSANSALKNVKNFAIVECSQKMGSMKQLGYFIQDISSYYNKVVLIQQVGPNYKYDQSQFAEIICERTINLPELTIVKPMERIQSLEDLKNMIIGSKVDKQLKKIDFTNEKIAFIFALSFRDN